MTIAKQLLATSAPSSGFDWRALVVGAVLALAAQAIVQLVVVPHVDARRRRETRWEEDVLTLGEVLTAQLPGAAEELRTAVWWLGMMHTLEAKSPEAHERLVREAQQKLEPIYERWFALQARFGWLTERVLHLVSGDPRLTAFERAVAIYGAEARGAELTGVLVMHAKPPAFDEDKLNAQWAKEGAARAKLLAAVKKLVGEGPPRRSRFRQTVRVVKQRRGRRRRSYSATKVD